VFSLSIILNILRHLTILGSTGSIGVNTLDVVRRHPGRYKVEFLTTNRQIDKLEEQIVEFSPRAVVVLDDVKAVELRARSPKCEVLTGKDSLLKVAAADEVDTLVGALVGFAGLEPTIEAIKKGKRICIANKESLVVAGEILSALAKESGSEIIPIDSEHSAIAQCLVGESHESIKRIILTASGGPFRTRERSTFTSISVEDALKHPNWVMGQKITIDSATLMNKGLEVIEAKWLFNLPLSKVDVVVHPGSIVHSFVEFVDGSVKAQLGAPDMRLPIQYALEYPERLAQDYDLLDLLKTRPLEFHEPDLEKFPCLRLAREAGDRGGLYPCVLNAANEIAVELFLKKEIGFMDIPRLVEEALDSTPPEFTEHLHAGSAAEIEVSLDRIRFADSWAREFVHERTLGTRTATV
jgi:1-deoxy-D-xylulose-5-phosphate reductoisomerase